MNIKEYRLTILDDDGVGIKELVYLGNENIIIKSSPIVVYDENKSSLTFPRHILEKFVEMINDRD